VREEAIESPWGEPSAPVRHGTIAGLPVVFLPRHDKGHRLSPSDINYRANIDVLKRAGVTDLISLSACGSFKEELPPGTFVLVDQFVDRTYKRESSFFGKGCVAHVSMAHPVSPRLRIHLAAAAEAEVKTMLGYTQIVAPFAGVITRKLADVGDLAAPGKTLLQMENPDTLRFEADVLRGQKTGFFLDQRENRRQVEALARGRDVLNAFSFSGGFSLYAARGGARSVTDLDLSAHALAGAKRNVALNAANASVTSCGHEFVQADAFEWLNEEPERKFDLVILDPPSLAKREIERPGAIRAYGRLALSGIEHLRPGGILVACSCSAHVTAKEFFEAVRKSAVSAGRTFRELRTTGHAPDHPATFKEAEYLKAIYLNV